MKKASKKILKLSRETLKNLNEKHMAQVVGGRDAPHFHAGPHGGAPLNTGTSFNTSGNNGNFGY